MTITGPIPLPESGVDALMSGMSNSQSMINSMMNNRYNQGILGVQQQAQARAERLLPHLVQQYEDTHKKTASEQHMNDMYNAIVEHEIREARPDLFGQQKNQSGNGLSEEPVSINSTAPYNFTGIPGQNNQSTGMQPGEHKRELPQLNRLHLIASLRDPNISESGKKQIAAFLMANLSAAQANVIPTQEQSNQQILSDKNRKNLENFIASGQASPEDVQQIKQFLNVTQSAVPQQQSPMPIQPGEGVPQQPQNQMLNQTQGMPQPIVQPGMPQNLQSGMQQNNLQSGNEIEIRPSIKGQEWRDGRIQGIGKFPMVSSKFDPKLGIIYRSYPSGKQTVQKLNLPGMKTVNQETPEERQQREINTKVESSKGIINAKEASKIKEQAVDLVYSSHLVQEGYKILDENPDLTGLGSGLSSSLHISNNPALGKFATTTGQLQAKLAKYASQRGGIQAIRWVSSVKPDKWQPEDYNYGMFDQIKENINNDFETLNEQYKDITGKDLPIKPNEMKSKRHDKEKTISKKVTKKYDFINGQLKRVY